MWGGEVHDDMALRLSRMWVSMIVLVTTSAEVQVRGWSKPSQNPNLVVESNTPYVASPSTHAAMSAGTR